MENAVLVLACIALVAIIGVKFKIIFPKWRLPMAKVQITVSLNINPAPPPPLTVDKSSVSLPDEQVGVDAGPVAVAVVSGGVPPFSVALDPSSPSPLPPGLTPAVDAQGNVTLSGVPSAAGSGSFVLAVSDSGN